MDLLVVKIVAMILMGSLALFFGLLPLKVKKLILKGKEDSKERKKRERILSGFLCFGAGVLLATVFIHMIPETRGGFDKVSKLRQSNMSSSARNSRHYHPHDDFTDNSSSGQDQKGKKLHYTEHNHDHTNSNAHQDLSSTHDHSHEHNHVHEHSHVDDHNHVHENNQDHVHSHDHGHSHAHEHNHSQEPNRENDIQEESTPRTENELKKTEKIIKSDGLATSLNDHHHGHHDDDDVLPNQEENKREISDSEDTIKKDSSDHSHNTEVHNHDHQSDPNLPGTIQPVELSSKKNDSLLPDDNTAKLIKNETHSNITAGETNDNNNNDTLDVAVESPSRIPHTSVREETPLTGVDGKESRIKKRSAEDNPSSPSLTSASSNSSNNEGRGNQSLHNHSHEDEDGSHSYPLAELVVCLGFFIIYFIEEIMHKIFFRHSKDGHHNHFGSSTNNILEKNSEERSQHNLCHHGNHIPPLQSPLSSDGLYSSKKLSSKNGQAKNGNNQVAVLTSMTSRSEWGVQGIDNPVFAGDVEATSWNPRIKESLVSNNQVPAERFQSLQENQSASLTVRPAIDEPDRGTINGSVKQNKSSHILANLRSLLIVIALSFHAVFEGMAIGLQEIEKDVWYLFLAISAHKYVICFSVGLELATVGTPLTLFVVYVLILALVTPFGIGIGIIISEYNSVPDADHQIIITILQGLAGGTILYVAIIEVLERERSKRGGRLVKLFCLLIGFALMAALESVGGHSH